MKNRIQKLLSLLLVLCMLTAFFPNVIHADDVTDEKETEASLDDERTVITEKERAEDDGPSKEVSAADKLLTPLIVEEDATRRSEYAKHFLCEDGSYIAITYSNPVHTLVDGEWLDAFYDVEKNDGRISASDGTVSLAADSKSIGEALTELVSGEYTLKWNIEANKGADKSVDFSKDAEASVKTSGDIALENKEKAESSTKLDLASAKLAKEETKSIIESEAFDFENAEDNEDVVAFNALADEYNRSKIFAVSEAKSVVVYKDAFGRGSDVRYTLSKGKIEEDVILNSAEDFRSYTEIFDAAGLKAVLNENNSVSFVNEEGEEIFVIASPVMYDAAENYSEAIKVSLSLDGDRTRVTYTPDRDWLTSKDRVFPVVIDPTVSTLDLPLSNQIDNYIHNDQGNTVVNPNLSLLKVGYEINTEYRALWKVTADLPAIPSGSNISGVHFNVKVKSGTEIIGNIALYEVRGNWSDSTVKWSNRPTQNRFVRVIKDKPANNWLSYSRSSLGHIVTDMYTNGVSNYGFILKFSSHSELVNEIYSSDCDIVTNIPYLEIRYTTVYNDITPGYYYVKNVKTNKYLNVTDAATSSGSPVKQYHMTGQPEQIWNIQRVGNTDKYTFEAMHTFSRYLYWGNNSLTEIRNINGDDEARWRFEEYETGKYLISSVKEPWMVLDVDHSSTLDDALIYVFPMHGNQNQQWVLESIESLSLGTTKTNYVTSGKTISYTFITPYSGNYVFSANKSYSVPANIVLSSKLYKNGNEVGSSSGNSTEIALNMSYDQRCFLSITVPESTTTCILNVSVALDIANGVYYFNNQETMKYADIENQTMQSGTTIHQWELHGGSTQRWEISQLSDEYHSIRSVSSNGTDYYLGVENDSTANNASIVLRSKTNGVFTDGMKWKIQKLNNGNFKITPKTGEYNNRVLAIGFYILDVNGIDIEQRDYVYDDNYKDEWQLYPTPGNRYKLLAIDDVDGGERNGFFEQVTSDITEKLGSDIYIDCFESIEKNDIMRLLCDSKIFIIHTHGDNTSIKLSPSSYLSMSDIDDLCLNNLRFALLLTCRGAEDFDASHITNNNPVNITEKMVCRGAETVVGFTNSIINVVADEYARRFSYNFILNGRTVCCSIMNINYDSKFDNYIIDYARIAGNTQLTAE